MQGRGGWPVPIHHQSRPMRRADSPPDYYGSFDHGPHTGCPVHSPFRYWLDEHGVPGPSYQSYIPPPIPRHTMTMANEFPPRPPRPISRTLHRRNTQPVRNWVSFALELYGVVHDSPPFRLLSLTRWKELLLVTFNHNFSSLSNDLLFNNDFSRVLLHMLYASLNWILFLFCQMTDCWWPTVDPWITLVENNQVLKFTDGLRM